MFNEIHGGIKKSEDPAFRLTMLQALGGVIRAGGQRMNEKHRGEIQGQQHTCVSRSHTGACLGLIPVHV